MKTLFTFIIIFIVSVSAFAQEQVYAFAQVMPQYPGGYSAAKDYFRKNIRYTKGAIDNGWSGTVAVKLTILKDGTVGNAEVKTGLDYAMERVIKDIAYNMPAWKPGQSDGYPVAVFQSVVFQIPPYHPGMAIDTVAEKVEDSIMLAAEIKAKEQADIAANEQMAYDSTILASIRKNEKEYRAKCIAKFGAKNGAKIADGKIELGMSKDMCKYAWGSPLKTNTTAAKEGVLDTWVYSAAQWVVFKNGAVISVTQ